MLKSMFLSMLAEKHVCLNVQVKAEQRVLEQLCEEQSDL